MTNCAIVFDHELSNETLKSTKTNNSNDLSIVSNSTSKLFDQESAGLSKILKVQTITVNNKDTTLSLACLVWTMCQENTPAIYYLTIFDLNNWYIEWMPRKMQIYSNEFDSNGSEGSKDRS